MIEYGKPWTSAHIDKKVAESSRNTPKYPTTYTAHWSKSINYQGFFVKKPASYVHCLCEGASLEMQQIYNKKSLNAHLSVWEDDRLGI